MSGLRTRIAPTPSGYLHFGNGVNFSVAWQLANARNGTVLLRIDDGDEARARPEYIDDVFGTLEWLGIPWQEGPADATEFTRTWSQPLRRAEHERLLSALREQGMVYACDCSRSQVQGRSPNGHYPGTCRQLGKYMDDPSMAWRLDLSNASAVTFTELGSEPFTALPGELLGDPVVRTRGGAPAYHIASLSDDVRFSIDTVVRGADLLPSTVVQVHIARLLGLDAFAKTTFFHHPLVTDTEGRKLSKSAGSSSLRYWRSEGRSAAPVHEAARRLLTARGLLPTTGEPIG